MNNWIFLSKNGIDEYINMFANGCGVDITDTRNFNYNDSFDPIVLRGIRKYKIMARCWTDSRKFYYMDSGYFGNSSTDINPRGFKLYHRIVPNDLQHNKILSRPADRWESLKLKFKPWNRAGKNIVIVVPDEKPCSVYGTNVDQWLADTMKVIKANTDRPIVIRRRIPSRQARIIQQPLESILTDAFALVVYNSNAATEAIINGCPVFVTAPCHAALPVAETDLSRIEHPYYPNRDKLWAWACHLAYGQFHIAELKSGSAKYILEEY